MNFRTICIAIIVAMIGVLAAFNWTALSTPTVVSLGVTEIQAPLGVLMLALTILLSVFFMPCAVDAGSVLNGGAPPCQGDAGPSVIWRIRPRLRALRVARVLKPHARGRRLDGALYVLEAHLVQRAQESDNARSLCGTEQQVHQIIAIIQFDSCMRMIHKRWLPKRCKKSRCSAEAFLWA